MRVVIDTNILFSSLLAGHSRLRDILLESEHEFYAPNYLFVELFRYKDKIKKVGKLKEDDLLAYLQMVLEKIHFVQINLISDENRQIAYDLCKEVDVKDTVFVALCLELDAQLWTKDKKLKNHLLQKGFNQIFEY
ncbi:MAG: PIN domain-containing protein [Microscillaceae bacterium]|nr:PIN domain-containing protein [Microscillaceae bacterium]